MNEGYKGLENEESFDVMVLAGLAGVVDLSSSQEIDTNNEGEPLGC